MEVIEDHDLIQDEWPTLAPGNSDPIDSSPEKDAQQVALAQHSRGYLTDNDHYDDDSEDDLIPAKRIKFDVMDTLPRFKLSDSRPPVKPQCRPTMSTFSGKERPEPKTASRKRKRKQLTPEEKEKRLEARRKARRDHFEKVMAKIVKPTFNLKHHQLKTIRNKFENLKRSTKF